MIFLVERFSVRVFAPLALLAGYSLAGCSDADEPNDEAPSNEGGAGNGGEEVPGIPAEFEYVPVEGAVCGNGSPFGIGVSEAPNARELVLFLNGGGACWDELTCFGFETATHLSVDYDEDLLDEDLAPIHRSGLVDRTPGVTPFSGASFAFVPYCTGDLFAGELEREYAANALTGEARVVHHVGRRNLRLIVAELAGRFPAVERVFLTGASAGGYGALLNYEVVASAFPDVRVDLLVDGSPAIEPTDGLYATWQSQWGIEGLDCEGCREEVGAVVRHLHASHPDRRFALLTSENDEVIRTFFGYGFESIAARVESLVDTSYEQDNARAFVVPGTEHVLLGAYRRRRGPGEVSLADFVESWVTGEGFVSVRP